MITMGKKDIMKLFVLPSSRNGSNFVYHSKIYQHLSLPFNQKPRHLSLPLKLSPPRVISNKNAKKKEHNVDKKELLRAHAALIQTLQNEFKSLRAQLTNLKGKFSQPTTHAQSIQGSGSQEGPLRSFYGLSHDTMVGEYVFSNAHNSNLTSEFATFFCPSYFTTQKASVTPRFSATRKVIQTNELASGSNPITRLEELE